MYKIVIVDDERIIRSGLCNFFDWKAMGFEVVGSFEDGDETIDYIKTHAVDVLLTDINMPNVSGIELAKYIHENKLATKVVMISGYKEFEYAKKAIEYNVENYILKPVDREEITQVFSNLKNVIDTEKQKQNERKEEKQFYLELLPKMRQQFFLDILMGALQDKDVINNRLKTLKVEINPSVAKCCIVTANILKFEQFLEKDWHYGKEKLETALINFIDIEKENCQYYSIFENKSQFKIIVISKTAMSIELMKEGISQTLDIIQKSIKQMLNLDLELSMNCFFNSIYELNTYRMQESTYIGSLDIVFDYTQLQNICKSIITKINEDSADEVMNVLKRFFDEISHLPIKDVHRIIIDFFALLRNKFASMGFNLWEILGKENDYHKIVTMQTIEEINKWTQKAIIEAIEKINKQKETTAQKVIDLALNFINANYQNDISRADVADHIYLNPSYFSRYFKQETGETFSDYITRIRMEKAIEILKQEKYKTHEISDKVGYRNSKNFTRVFKKYTGYTPTDYLRNYKEGV